MLSLVNSISSPCASIPATTKPAMSQSFSAEDPFSHATKHPKQNVDDSINIELNHKYLLDTNISGTCAFIGNTSFAKGEWIGLIIENDSNGNNNGTINNKQYFICENNRGLFVRKEKIIYEIPIKDRHFETENDDHFAVNVSFFTHEHIESTNINVVLNNVEKDKDKDIDDGNDDGNDSPLSLELNLGSHSSPIMDNILDDTPDTFAKLNDYFSTNDIAADNDNTSLNVHINDDNRRVSMMETFNGNDTLHISALLPIQKRMNLISSIVNETWKPFEYDLDKDLNQNSSFLKPKLNNKYSINNDTKSTKTYIKKMGPIDIGRIEYKTPFEEIEKSPFNIETYKTWYPKKTSPNNSPKKTKSKSKSKQKHRYRSVSTIDTNWNRNRKNSKRNKKKNTKKIKSPKSWNLAWIEKDNQLIKNPKYKPKIIKNNKLKPNKKKKPKAKSSRVKLKSKGKKQLYNNARIRTSSGPLIRLSTDNTNTNNINVILEDSCTDIDDINDINDINQKVNTIELQRSQSHSPSKNSENSKDKRKSQSAKRWNDTQTIKIKHFFL